MSAFSNVMSENKMSENPATDIMSTIDLKLVIDNDDQSDDSPQKEIEMQRSSTFWMNLSDMERLKVSFEMR